MVHITIHGKSYDITQEQVSKALSGISPEFLGGQRKYYIEVNDQHYPIKQVLGVTLQLPRVAFTSMYAYQVLSNLGFKIYEA